MAFPSGGLSTGQRDLAADLGLSVGAAIFLRMGPELSLYAGVTRDGFACAPNFDCDVEGGFTSQGYELGAEYVLPHETVFEPWIRAGATFHRFRYYTGGGFETQTDPAAGFELGGGVSIPFRERLMLTPALRFARYVAHLNLNTYAAGGEPFTVTKILLDVGMRLRP